MFFIYYIHHVHMSCYTDSGCDDTVLSASEVMLPVYSSGCAVFPVVDDLKHAVIWELSVSRTVSMHAHQCMLPPFFCSTPVQTRTHTFFAEVLYSVNCVNFSVKTI